MQNYKPRAAYLESNLVCYKIYYFNIHSIVHLQPAMYECLLLFFMLVSACV